MLRSLVGSEMCIRDRHSLNHPGGRATLRGIRERFVWAKMSSDCLAFVRGCLPCQRSKIVRHARTPWADRPLPDARFLSLHLDLVGPLPESEGKSYILTIIDRYSRWLEAVPPLASPPPTVPRLFFSTGLQDLASRLTLLPIKAVNFPRRSGPTSPRCWGSRP